MPKTISTRSLLVAGVVASVAQPTIVAIQAFTREGFDLAVHPLSLLSLGQYGWIQITNFILTGLLYIAFALGLKRVLTDGIGRSWGPVLFGFYGVILVGAGIFTVDPMYGFPPGAPEGLPSELSWHALIHNFTFILAFLGLIVAQFIFARRFASTKEWGYFAYSLLTGIATPILIVLSQSMTDNTGYILFGVGLVVNVWIVTIALKMLSDNQAVIGW